jgi:hypothetical protein
MSGIVTTILALDIRPRSSFAPIPIEGFEILDCSGCLMNFGNGPHRYRARNAERRDSPQSSIPGIRLVRLPTITSNLLIQSYELPCRCREHATAPRSAGRAV